METTLTKTTLLALLESSFQQETKSYFQAASSVWKTLSDKKIRKETRTKSIPALTKCLDFEELISIKSSLFMLVMLAKDSLVDLHPYTLYLASLLLTSPSAKALTSTNPMISLLVSTISLPPTPVLHCLYTSLMSLKCSRMFGFDEKTKTEYSKFKQQKNVWSPDPSMEYESLLPTPSDLDELSNLAEGHDHPVDTLDEEQDLISQPEMDILEDPVEDSEHNQPADHLDHDDAFSQNELHENDHPHTIETAPTEPPLSNDKKKKKKTRKKATSGQPNSTSTPDYPSNSLEPSFQPMSTHPFSTAPPDQPSQKPLAPTDIEDELNDLDELVLEDEESPHPSERVLKDDGHQNTLQLTVHSDPIHDEDLSDDDNELDTTHNTHSKKFFEGQIVVWNKENSPTVDKGEPTTKKEKQRRVTKAEKQKEEYERLSLLSEIDTLRSKLRQTTTQLEWEKKTSERYKVEMIAIQGQLREESAKWEKERKMRKKTNKKYKELLQQLDDQNNHKQNADENKPNSDWNESDDEPAHPKSGRVSESEGQPLSTPVFDELNPMSFILTPHAEITTITSHTPRSQKEEELRKDTQNSEQDVPTEPLSQIDESKTEEVEKNDENEVKSPNQTISELLAQFQRLQIENERLKKQEEEWKEGSPIKQHLPDSPEHKDGNTDMSHTTSLVTPQKTIEQDSPPMSESYSLIDSFLKDRQDQEKEEKRVLEDTIRREVERKRREEDEERRVRVAGIGERASGMNEKDRAVSLFFLFRVAKHLLKQAKREVKRETERKRKEELERDIHNQTTPERFVVPSQTSHLHRSETRSHVPFLYPFTHTQDTSHQRQQQTQNERVHHTQTQQSSSQHTLQPQSTPTSYTSPFSQHINLAQSLLLPRVMDDGRGVVQALELIKFNEFGKLDRVWMEECFTVMNGTIGRKKKEKRQTQNGDKRNEETDSFEGETIQDMVGEWQHFERLQHEWEEIRKEIEEREWAESALKAVERERENTNHQTGESHTHPHSDSPQVLSSPLQTPQNLDRTSNTMSTVRRESLNLFDTLLGVPDSIQQLHSQAPSTNLLLVSNSSLLNSILCPSNSSSPSLTLSAFPLLVSILLSTTVLEQISVGMREEISLLTDVDHQFHNTFPSHIETQPQPHFMDRRERTHDDEWMSEEQSEREQRQSPKPSIQSEKEDADSDSGQSSSHHSTSNERADRQSQKQRSHITEAPVDERRVGTEPKTNTHHQSRTDTQAIVPHSSFGGSRRENTSTSKRIHPEIKQRLEKQDLRYGDVKREKERSQNETSSIDENDDQKYSHHNSTIHSKPLSRNTTTSARPPAPKIDTRSTRHSPPPQKEGRTKKDDRIHSPSRREQSSHSRHSTTTSSYRAQRRPSSDSVDSAQEEKEKRRQSQSSSEQEKRNSREMHSRHQSIDSEHSHRRNHSRHRSRHHRREERVDSGSQLEEEERTITPHQDASVRRSPYAVQWKKMEENRGFPSDSRSKRDSKH